MTTKISGSVEDTNGNAIGGAVVYIVRESDDTVVGTATTDSAGSYEVTGLSDTETYHVVAAYDDGSTKYHGESYPLVEPYTETGPIDDFEDNEIVEYSGDKLSFDTQNSVVYEGTVALEMHNDDGASHDILSTSGLPRYPNAGDTFQFRLYFENAESSGEMKFGVQDSDNYYRARVVKNPYSNEISLDKRVGGSLTNLETAFGTIPFGTIPTSEWMRGVIDWVSNGDLTFTLYDASGSEIASTNTVNDSEFSTGGIGWDGYVDSFSGDNVYYDIAKLTAVGQDPTVVIEDFEDNDLSNYDTQIQTGNANPTFNIVTSPVYEGSYALQVDDGGDNQGGHLLDTNDETQYPDAGDSWDFWVRADGESELVGMFYGVQDDADNTRYHANFHENQDRIDLVKWAGTSQEIQATSQSFSYTLGTWVRGHVDWATDGTHTFKLFDQNDNEFATVTMSDSEMTSGGIGWHQSNGSTDYGPVGMDYAHM